MADQKKRPVLKTTVSDDKKTKYKETPKTGSKEARPTAREASKKNPGDALSEKLGKGMAYGIDYAIKSTNWARQQKKSK